LVGKPTVFWLPNYVLIKIKIKFCYLWNNATPKYYSNMRNFTLFAFICFAFVSLKAQSPATIEEQALEYIQAHAEDWQVEAIDVREMKLVDAYRGSKSGVYHMYYTQQWNGTDIYNAVTGIHVKDGEVKFAAPRVHGKLQEKIKDFEPAISAQSAVELAAGYLGISSPSTALMASLSNDVDEDVLTYAPGNISKRPIPVRKVYQLAPDGSLRLAWDLSIELQKGVDWMSMRIDAINGTLLDDVNWTVKCSFGEGHPHGKNCMTSTDFHAEDFAEMAQSDSASYRIFPFPYENPLYGPRQTVVNPADEEASPLGWHDIDGVEGPEFTTTQGNNTHAFPARQGNLSPDFDVDGGQDLSFDFPFESSLEPQDYTEAATANLFYVINMMHDIAYHYGLDEAAGNFQTTNYTGEGVANDHVLGAAQFDGNSGGSINNATFSTPSDGGNGVMRMFEWNNESANQEFVTVLEPQAFAGKYAAGTAEFGQQLGPDSIVGEVVIVNDGFQVGSDGCEEIQNGDEVNGKIALIDRGECSFSVKAFNAQQQGAIAVIICNNQGNGIINMAGAEDAELVTIPSVFMARADCNEFRVAAGSDLVIQLKEPDDATGPDRYDGSLDNGIIAHEYGHGISNRLTGGASASGCLGNDEQMGEGWSDFFTVVLTVDEDDDPSMSRGIGAYVTRDDIDGRGIRNYPYSTDMDVNPQTYEDVILSGTAPHPLGEIWNVMLWDLHWALVGEYGFDPDMKNGTGGNNICIQLVMEGLALQACSPGFVDGRNAILAADELLYDGANQCLIWDVFARRGLGVDADQGLTSTRRDAKENFDSPISCVNDIFIEKSSTPNIEFGETFEVNVNVANFTDESQENIVITDIIPDDCTYVMGSANIDPSSIDNQVITFEIDSLGVDGNLSISYELQSAQDKASRWMEENDFNETSEVVAEWIASDFAGDDPFRLLEDIGPDTSQAWFVPNTGAENDQFLFKFTGHDLTGEFPVLRFTHKYLTNPGTDGGIIEISTDGGNTFNDIEPLMFRGPYRGKLDYSTFAKVNQRAFWGDSEGFFTTYVDLSPYANEQGVFIRFRFGTQVGSAAEGWTIDDLHIFDALTYDTEATVTYNGGLTKSARPSGMGTIVEPNIIVNTENPESPKELAIFPNPAKEQINIKLPHRELSSEYIIYDMHGRAVLEGRSAAGQIVERVQTTSLQGGLYILQIMQGEKMYQSKVVIQ